MALSETMNSYTPEEETKIILNPPDKLSANHPVETPFGTWHMDGGIAIFEANVFGIEKHSQSDIPKVKDINAFTNGLLEKELEHENYKAIEAKPAVRRPLSIKKILAAATTIGL